MPLFVLHALDHQDALELRMRHYDAHRAFIETEIELGLTIVLSGPLQSDDGEVMIGSMFVIDAESRAEVERFVEADPFTRAGVWNSVSIVRFHRRKG
jgi:uncharacterized protein YciI